MVLVWRKKSFFEEGWNLLHDPMNFIFRQVEIFSDSLNEQLNVLGEKKPRVERLISWKPPSSEWLKLNTDDSSLGNPSKAGARIFRVSRPGLRF